MGKTSDITWTDATFNPWWGCQKVSPGCDRCYAMTLAERMGWRHKPASLGDPEPDWNKFRIWGPPKTTLRRTFEGRHWSEPLAWNAAAEKAGVRRRVFCASMADVFEDHPGVGNDRLMLWQLMSSTPMLDWLVLTKRPENVRAMVPQHWLYDASSSATWAGWPKNVWLGVSVENQQYAATRIPILIRLPAAVRFLSCEPLLGPVDLGSWIDPNFPVIDWVIVGGESGSGFRPMSLDWARDLRDQCVKAGIAFHFKQHGGARHDSGGRLLDGRTWDEFPAAPVLSELEGVTA